MQAVRKDDVLKGRLDLTKPCPWELLSLLVDTPVAERDTKMLEKGLSAAQMIGLKMVSRMQVPMQRCASLALAPFAVIFSYKSETSPVCGAGSMCAECWRKRWKDGCITWMSLRSTG
eukprot:COSAG03_NODE_7591_length_896_cov_153.139272_1_plen_117_part_00